MSEFKNNLGGKTSLILGHVLRKITFILGTCRNNVHEIWLYQHDNEHVDAFCSRGGWVPFHFQKRFIISHILSELKKNSDRDRLSMGRRNEVC